MMMSLALAKKNIFNSHLFINANELKDTNTIKNRLYFSFIIRRFKYHSK